MSNYKLYEFYRKKGETAEQKTYNPFEIQGDAEALFDTKLSTALKATDEVFHFLLILDNSGAVIAKEFVGEGYMQPKLLSFKWDDNEGKEKLESISYDVKSDVISNYYAKLGTAKRSANIRSIAFLGLDAQGNEIISTYWVRPIQNVESEPEPESESGE